MRVVFIGGDGAHLLGAPDGVVVVFVLVLAQEVAHFHVLEEVFGLGVLVGQVHLVVAFGAWLLAAPGLLLPLRPLVPQGLEEVLVDLLEGVGCEEQVVVLLLQYVHNHLPLLGVGLADLLELLGQLAPHLRHVHVLG